MRRYFVTILTALLLGAVAFGQGGEKLTVGTQADLTRLDLHLTTNYLDRLALLNVQQQLLSLDRNTNIVPVLLESYETNENVTEYLLHVRDNVTFHNGEELSAADVKYSLDRYIQDGRRSSDFAGVTAVEVVDDKTVRVVLSEPDSNLPVYLANPIAPVVILPEGEVERQGGEIREPIGTGPFQFVEHVADRYLRLERYEDFVPINPEAGGLAGYERAMVETVDFVPIPERSTRAAALESGGIDIAMGLDYLTYEQLQGSPNVIVETVPSFTIYEMRLGLKDSIVADPMIRQAIAHAVNKEEIDQGLNFGLAGVAHSFVLPDSAYQRPALQEDIAFDPERARELLQEAGYDGEELVLKVWSADPYPEIGLLIESQLEEVGMNVQVRPMELAAWAEDITSGNYDFSLNGLSIRPDPIAIYKTLWASDSTGSGWMNEEFDQAVADIGQTIDTDERAELFVEMHEQILQDLPVMALTYGLEIQGWREAVEGYDLWGGGYVPIDGVSVNR